MEKKRRNADGTGEIVTAPSPQFVKSTFASEELADLRGPSGKSDARCGFLMAERNSKRYRAFNPLSGSEPSKSYMWDNFLESVVESTRTKNVTDDRCSDFVVPVESFCQAPFAEYMKFLRAEVRVEATLLGDYGRPLNATPLYWIARVIKIAGYRLLLRFEGMEEEGDEVHDFWMHIASPTLRHVGFCTEDPANRVLIPPESIYSRHEDWAQYTLCQMHALRTLTPKWPEIQQQKLNNCLFKVGDRVELLDSMVCSRVRPARIEKFIGSRILVKLSMRDLKKEHLNDPDNSDDEDPQVDGIWMDEESPLIFHVGWATLVGYELAASEEYTKHAAEVARALKSGSSSVPFAKNDALPGVFETFEDMSKKDIENSKKFLEWQAGTKLEVLDPLDAWKEMRVATVMEVMERGYLKIGFDSEEMEEDPVPLHCTSPLLFPVGYSEKYGVKLKGPSGSERFSWAAYLKQNKSTATDPRFFDEFDEKVVASKFKVGAKLEAVDMCEPVLICAATVAAIKGRLVQIKYDGWDDSFDQLFDYRSNNLFPLGWCEMFGHKLEAPKTEKKKSKSKK